MVKLPVRSVAKMISMVFIVFHISIAQTAGITSGAIYSLKSKSSNKMLNVSNASIVSGANVDTWTDTKSDAERWVVNFLGNNLYTLTNVGSGKLLHIANTIPANSVNVDQSINTNDNTVKWNIVDAGDGDYQLKASSNNNFSLDLWNGINADGANVHLWQSNLDDAQKWEFQIQTAQASAPSAEIADQVYTSWKTKYYYTTASGGGRINNEGFWGVAEMMEIIDDAYEVTGFAKYRDMLDEMYRGFIEKEGADWMWNEYNDDITWMVIASVRATLLTGNQTYLIKAKEQFDKMFARANTHQFGGDGLVWKQGVVGTNSCINGPAMVACMYLVQATGDTTYVSKAKKIYEWSKLYLFNRNTGKVNDNYNGTIGTWSSTYNQGTYLGASVMLYNYTKDTTYRNDAIKIASFTQNDMFKNNVINDEEGPDLNGFKGIFMRYARRYVVDLNRADYIPWLRLNAKVAYNNRNSEGIIGTKWGTRRADTTKYAAFNASTAMSLMFNCPLSTTITKNAYTSIEAENFDYHKGMVVEKTSDATGNNQIGGILNGYYTAYMNVDFGAKGTTSVVFRLSSATTGGTIEIRLGGVTGTLIGIATVTGTGDWNAYTSVNTSTIKTTGIQNIFLVYKGSGYLFNINNFRFIEEGTLATSGTSTVHPITVQLNTTTSLLTINGESLKIKSISISNVNGQKLYDHHIATAFRDNTHEINVTGYIRGVYFVSIITIEGSRFNKMFLR